MIYLFIGICLIIALLVGLMFLILKRTVDTINNKTKTYFVDKLQEYDYLINEKEEKLNEIDNILKNKRLGLEEKDNINNKFNYDFDYNIIDLLNKTEYQDKNIFEINKKIDEKFIINYEDLIKNFLSHIDNNNKYDFCVNLIKKFTSDIIYDLKTKLDNEKEETLSELLNEEEYKVYEIFKKITTENSIESFIDYLNQLVDLNNPKIKILVGSNKENYDYLNNNIETIISRDVYKGIKIIYRNRIYDFSLNERNV